MSKAFGHTIRVLLAGEYIDGFVQPNGGWKTIWVEDGQDEWAAIRKAIRDVRRVIRYEQVPSPCHQVGVNSDPKANKDCVMCRGRGTYTALQVGEYDEMPMSIKCSCTRRGLT